MDFSRTIIISCAGMGNRLGMETTKALLEIDGKPLIIHTLQQLGHEPDIRIVVGYQADKVIDVVKDFRSDVVFVFNHNYMNTGTGDSVLLAARHSNDYILSIDGDLLVHPDDMRSILECHNEFVGGNPIESDDPWFLQTYIDDEIEFVSAFSKCMGQYEWNGITQIKSKKMLKGTGHVFHLIEPHLPMEFKLIRTREIDTPNDYERAISWVKNHYNE